MPGRTQENRPLLTGSDPICDPELARSPVSQSHEEPRSDEEAEADDSGLTASGHHIDDAHQQTT